MKREAARGWRMLARLLPAWFREEHGDEMAELFAARLARRRGAGARARLWWSTAKDMVTTAVALRRAPPRGRRGREGGTAMETLSQDVRYAARRLARSPVFTLGAVALLAVGIGANATVFSLVDALLFRPPPWERPEEVVHVYQDSDEGEPATSSYPATRDMAASPVFSDVAAFTASSASWEGPDGPVDVATEYVTASYMRTLGLSVQRGRWFGAEHDVPGGEAVAVLTAHAWRSRFGSDPGVVGRTIRLNGHPVTILGVGPERLTGSYTPLATDLWLSISTTHVSGPFQVANLERRMDHWYDVRARLAPGVTVEQAQAAMDALASRLAEEYPELNRGRGITVFPSSSVRIHPSADGDLYAAGGLLSSVVLTVLLLACANLANLLLVRGMGRTGEMAVRTALGAPRGRVARLFLLESLLLSAAGAAAGILLARWALAIVPTLPIPLPRGATLELGVDARVLGFSLALGLGTGFLFGLAPALRAVRADVALTLRDDVRTVSGGRGMARLRNGLVAIQVAASLVLVLGTALIARSLGALQTLDTGVDPDRVAYLRTDWSSSGLEADARRAALDELLARVEAIPGVTRAAAASRLPAQPGGSTTTEVEGYTPPNGTGAVELSFATVSDGWFDVMGIGLVEGRTFGPDDVAGGPGVSIVINREAAERFWPGASALGRRMRGQGAEAWGRTVVGVVENSPVNGISEPPRPIMYFSSRQMTPPGVIVARTDGAPEALITPLREAVAGAGYTVTVSAQGTLAGFFGESLAAPRLVARLMSAFSALALVLAGLGIYAVVSFSVARRTAELGIRIALGAERGRVTRMVVGEVAGVVVAGLALGLGVAAVGSPRLEGVLYGVSGLDPVAFTVALAVMLAVALAAAWLPARRAARADPVEALRVS